MPVCHDVCEPVHTHGFLLEQQWTVLLEQIRNILVFHSRGKKKMINGVKGRAGFSVSPGFRRG